jgi:hypothetical protein
MSNPSDQVPVRTAPSIGIRSEAEMKVMEFCPRWLARQIFAGMKEMAEDD